VGISDLEEYWSIYDFKNALAALEVWKAIEEPSYVDK
jgi:hypothetical protein